MKAWRAGEKETAKWVKGETAESVGGEGLRAKGTQPWRKVSQPYQSVKGRRLIENLTVTAPGKRAR